MGSPRFEFAGGRVQRVLVPVPIDHVTVAVGGWLVGGGSARVRENDDMYSE